LSALLVERWEGTFGDERRFLDIHYYTASKIFNLRVKVPKGMFATEHNRGLKLTYLGKPEYAWAVENGKARKRCTKRANKQEETEDVKDDWQIWHQRFTDGLFTLVWSSIRKVKA
jgi:hypothetical protein